MTPYRRRLSRLLLWLRLGAFGVILFTGLALAALLRIWARSRPATLGEFIALALWGLVLLVGGGGALWGLRQVSIILKRMLMLGGSFSPKTPATSAESGTIEEKKTDG